MENAINVTDLTKKFGDFVAVNSISFEVKKGEIFGFLGANGAGKTTAMKVLCGLSFPTSGDGYVAGYNINTQREQIKKRIGYMSQKFSLYEDLTIKENVAFYATVYGLSRKEIVMKTEAMLKRLDVTDYANTLVGELPLGWKQKLAFLVAIVHDPEIVFLDEPTGGVDPLTRRDFWDLIYETAEKGAAVFVTTHYMDEAEYCDRVSIMVDGEISAMGTPDELKSKYSVETMDEVFYILARDTANK